MRFTMRLLITLLMTLSGTFFSEKPEVCAPADMGLLTKHLVDELLYSEEGQRGSSC